MKRLAAILLTSAAVMMPATAAFAAWTLRNNGSGKAAATKLPAATDPATPNANSGSTVRITFNAVTFNGKGIGTYPGGGYEVGRYAGATGGTLQGTATVCQSSPCDVAGVPDGTWYFGMAPALEKWRGVASATRVKAVVDGTAPTVTIVNFTAGSGAGNTKVTISGTASPSDGNVLIYFCATKPCSSTNRVTDSIGGIASVGANGTWSYTSANLGSGTYWATAQQTDSFGNVGTVTSGNTVTR